MQPNVAPAREPDSGLSAIGRVPDAFRDGMISSGLPTVVALLTDLPTDKDPASHLAKSSGVELSLCRQGLAVVNGWAHENGSTLHQLLETVRFVVPSLGGHPTFRAALKALALEDPGRQPHIYKQLTAIVEHFGNESGETNTAEWVLATVATAHRLKTQDLHRLKVLMDPLLGLARDIDSTLRARAVVALGEAVPGDELVAVLDGLAPIRNFTRDAAGRSKVTVDTEDTFREWTLKFPVGLYRLGLRFLNGEVELGGEISTGVLCALVRLARTEPNALMAALTTSTTVDCLKDREKCFNSQSLLFLGGAVVSPIAALISWATIPDSGIATGMGIFGMLLGGLAMVASNSIRLVGQHFNLSVAGVNEIVGQTRELLDVLTLDQFRKGAAFETSNGGDMARVLQNRQVVASAVADANVNGHDPILSDDSPARIFLEGAC